MTYDNNDGPIYSILNGKPCGTVTYYCNLEVVDVNNGRWDTIANMEGCNNCPNGWISNLSETGGPWNARGAPCPYPGGTVTAFCY